MVREPRLSGNHHPLRLDTDPLHGETIITSSDDIEWPFSKLEGLDRGDFREAAYEIFFTACRSSPGFGGRGGAVTSYNNSSEGGNGGGSNPGSSSQGVGMAVTSRVKRALGLKMLKRSPSRRASSVGSSTPPSSPGDCVAFSSVPAPRARRPMTSAEIMRRQMRVTEQSDNRLRKTLMRTLVGQMGRRAETIILPLELLRHLKPSEFYTYEEYHIWQKRQLKILEAGLLLNPSVPLEKSNSSAKTLREIIHASEKKAIDTSKNSELMKSLCNSVVSLSWRNANGSETDICHWADGYPLNIHIYMVLLHAIFDLKEETSVLDEVDELLELIKKTWNILGINISIHNVCFSWVLFEQYIVTGQVQHDLIGASLAMLNQVSADAKKVDRGPIYVKILKSVLISMNNWAEKRLIDYHQNFHRGTTLSMEHIIPIGFSATKILEDDVPGYAFEKEFVTKDYSDCNKVDNYICTSLQNAFIKMLTEANINGIHTEWQEMSDVLIKLATSTEDLLEKERAIFSPTLKIWHPNAVGIAALTLHTCYGTLLKQYLSGSSSVTNDKVLVLQRAGRLEKNLIRMVIEDSEECEDGGKAILKEMVPYEVDSLIMNLLRKWIQEKLKRGKEIVKRAKETETWNPKSKNEPYYAPTASDLTKNAKEAIESLFEIRAGISEDLIHELTYGLENLFKEYATFIASCGSKQSYLPTLPPLTRCSNDSRFLKLWKRATCGARDQNRHLFNEGNHPRPSTSRGTQRLYIRLNTLHYLLLQLPTMEKIIVMSSRESNFQGSRRSRKISISSYFDHTSHVIQAALQHVAEVAAYRLIFLDSNSVFYGSLYARDVENARIPPALRIIKQNLTLLCSIVTDRAHPLALKEVVKASFEAYLMVLLAGGSSRAFTRMDHQMIEEDFKSLKRLFCTCGEGLILEDSVDIEAEIVEGVITLMGQTTEHLVEDFRIIACEASGIGMVGVGVGVGEGQKLPMPPTTGRWNRSDANTILRVLCYRNDRPANHFLKRTFQLPKRRL